MDFHGLPRKKLQALCKKNKIPANITNVAMADALQSLPTVEGLEDLDAMAEAMMTPKPPRSAASARTCTRRSARTAAREGDDVCRKEAGGVPMIEITDTPTAAGTGRKVPRGRQAAKEMAEDVDGNKKVDSGTAEPPVTPTTVVSTRRSLRLRAKAATPVPLASDRRSRTSVESEGLRRYSRRRAAAAPVVLARDVDEQEVDAGIGLSDARSDVRDSIPEEHHHQEEKKTHVSVGEVSAEMNTITGDWVPVAVGDKELDGEEDATGTDQTPEENNNNASESKEDMVVVVVEEEEQNGWVVLAPAMEESAEEVTGNVESTNVVLVSLAEVEVSREVGEMEIPVTVDEVSVQEKIAEEVELQNPAPVVDEQESLVFVEEPPQEEEEEETPMKSENCALVVEETEESHEKFMEELRSEKCSIVEEEESPLKSENCGLVEEETEESYEKFMEELRSEKCSAVEEKGSPVKSENCALVEEETEESHEKFMEELRSEKCSAVEEVEEEELKSEISVPAEEARSENSAPLENASPPEKEESSVFVPEEHSEKYAPMEGEEESTEKSAPVEEESPAGDVGSDDRVSASYSMEGEEESTEKSAPVEEESPAGDVGSDDRVSASYSMEGEEESTEKSAPVEEESPAGDVGSDDRVSASSMEGEEESTEKSAPVEEESPAGDVGSDDRVSASSMEGEEESTALSERSAPVEEELPADDVGSDDRVSAASIENYPPVEEVAEMMMMQTDVTATLAEEMTTVAVRTPVKTEAVGTPVRTTTTTTPTRALFVLQDREVSPMNANREEAVGAKQQQKFVDMSMRQLRSTYKAMLSKNTAAAAATAKAEKRPALAALSESCPTQQTDVTATLVEETTTVAVRTPVKAEAVRTPVRTPTPTRALFVLQDRQVSPGNASREEAVGDKENNAGSVRTTKQGEKKNGLKKTAMKQQQKFEVTSMRRPRVTYKTMLSKKNTTAAAAAAAAAKAEKRPALAALSESRLNSPMKQKFVSAAAAAAAATPKAERKGLLWLP